MMTDTQPKKTKNQTPRVAYGPFYNVVCGGTTTEWTNKLSEAMGSFKDGATLPKTVYRINGKHVELIAHAPRITSV